MSKRLKLAPLLSAALLAVASGPCSAQAYTTKPVRVLVGIPAGGPPDVLGRWAKVAKEAGIKAE